MGTLKGNTWKRQHRGKAACRGWKEEESHQGSMMIFIRDLESDEEIRNKTVLWHSSSEWRLPMRRGNALMNEQCRSEWRLWSVPHKSTGPTRPSGSSCITALMCGETAGIDHPVHYFQANSSTSHLPTKSTRGHWSGCHAHRRLVAPLVKEELPQGHHWLLPSIN